MKRALIVMTAFSLSACTYNGSGPTKPEPVADSTGVSRAEVVSSGRKFAKDLCGFVPAAKTILEILDLGIPNVSKGAAIAEKICEAIGNTKGLKKPTFKGVQIEGQYE
ncbi:hypothetical protein ELH72_09635 [Rhizobium ruizarguesonis]|jgi:hypothetical protein|uniref:hypothetical protein n=1 Tax=Rhizobium ruizarguesonis TaxID=2081791 RepID=UPI001032458E|nr:hypothetical protein [Rhizobium ruizarguesonis]TAZ83487.1 hypothetical protein ELH72_09635 [Rhizobium ruizarguesonis]